MSYLSSGTCLSWLTLVLTELKGPDSPIPLNEAEVSWVASSMNLGFLITSVPSGILCNYIGRKPVILASFPLYMIGWILLLYSPTATTLNVVRIIHGCAMAPVFAVVPIYLGEIASDNCRGSITSLGFNSWWLGFVIQFAVGPYLSFYTFTYFTIAMHLPFVALYIWQPESPYYYVMIGDEDNARKSLQWFRNWSSEEIEGYLKDMKRKTEVKTKTTGFLDLFRTSKDRKMLLLLCTLGLIRALGGSGILVVFVADIFNTTPHLVIDPHLVSLIYGVVTFAGSCASVFIIDTLGRRPLLLFTTIVSFICQFSSGTYYYLLFKTTVSVDSYSWIVPIVVCLYSAMCTAGAYPVSSAYTTELFSTSSRGMASSVNTICITFTLFFMLFWFEPVSKTFGLHANFYCYSVFLLITSIYFYISAPETKGKSFAQIKKELTMKIIVVKK